MATLFTILFAYAVSGPLTFTGAVETMIISCLRVSFCTYSIKTSDNLQRMHLLNLSFLTGGWPLQASLRVDILRHQRCPHEERPACMPLLLQGHSERIFLAAPRRPNAQLQPGAWRFIFPMGGPWGGPSDFRCRCEITLWSSLLLGEDKMCDEEAHLRGL